MDQSVIEKLYQPFELKERPGQGGQKYKYVTSDDIVDRMNRVFEGNWSTEVKECKIIEDNVVILVRVYVTDPTNQSDKMYWQEGYASQFIARFTFGDKKGQPVDLGNTYKSAMSKAIKGAVAKWGVGLYLEADDLDGSSMTIPNVSPEKSHENVSVPPMTILPGESSAVSKPSSSFIPPNFPPLDDKQISDDVSSKPNQSTLPPMFTSAASPVLDNSVPVLDTSMSDFAPIDSANEFLTDIQKVAIETIMSVHNLKLNDLFDIVLKRSDNLPQSIDKVLYQDAVKIIHYGNNIKST